MRICVYYEPIGTGSEMSRYKMGCRRTTKKYVCLLLTREGELSGGDPEKAGSGKCLKEAFGTSCWHVCYEELIYFNHKYLCRQVIVITNHN